MANEIKDAREGLAQMLSQIDTLKMVYRYPPAQISRLPAAVIHFVQRQPDYTLGGSSSVLTFSIFLYAGSLNSDWAWQQLDKLLDLEGPDSIEAAIDSDNTLNGKVDDCRVEFPMGQFRSAQMIAGAEYYGATIPVRIVKQVTT